MPLATVSLRSRSSAMSPRFAAQDDDGTGVVGDDRLDGLVAADLTEDLACCPAHRRGGVDDNELLEERWKFASRRPAAEASAR